MDVDASNISRASQAEPKGFTKKKTTIIKVHSHKELADNVNHVCWVNIYNTRYYTVEKNQNK